MLSKAPFSFDILCISLFIIIPTLIYSIYSVKIKRNYKIHKILQILISTMLAISIIIFEIDIRIRGWKDLIYESKYYNTILWPIFYIHLFCAISTTVIWTIIFWQALHKFPFIPQPNEHSIFHKKFAPWATIGLIGTSITGITFYYVAFS